MTVIALTSTRSSPGVTSLAVALGLSWSRRAVDPLLIEADPAGGVLGLRFGLSSDVSLRTLRADMRRGYSAELVHRNSTDLRGVACLLAPTDPVLTTRSLECSAPSLADELVASARPTLIDIGRIFDRSPSLPFAQCASQVLVVTRPSVDDVQSLLYGIRLLHAQDCIVGLVVVGDLPHHPDEVAELAGVPIVGVVPDDRAVAGAFGGGRYSARKLRRTVLWRSVDSLGHRLLTDRQAASLPRPCGASALPVDGAAEIDATADGSRSVVSALVPRSDDDRRSAPQMEVSAR
jgi:MinD-like ATPase involved in chromosome partitioning or flagellar assembly